MTSEFREATSTPLALWQTPIRDLGLRIEGSALEPVLATFRAELDRAGLQRLKPRFYLSTEWGVPEDTVSIAIPFYLARPELIDRHAEQTGHIEGASEADLLRYLRHEMGHVVNYAYELYYEPAWETLFGEFERAYLEDYKVEPFSRRFVRHLPGWYAQKHPDEDFAETFAVWMTPGSTWRADYAAWPVALAKLEYVDRVVRERAVADPPVTDDELDEDVGELAYSIDEYYDQQPVRTTELPAIDGALATIFDDLGNAGTGARSAAPLVRAQARELVAAIYAWTGHQPERTRELVRHLAARAEALDLRYAPADEPRVLVALTTLVTALAMNHVHRGDYNL